MYPVFYKNAHAELNNNKESFIYLSTQTPFTPIYQLPQQTLALTWMASTLALTREKRAVGRATPILTGEMRASAVSQSSSIAMLMRAWKTRLHFTSG